MTDRKIKDFHDYVVGDLMANLDGIRSRAMFGGYAIYQHGFVFALITSDTELYFKVDDSLKAKFQAYDSHPFVYDGYKNKRPITMAYWLVPDEIMENPDQLMEWIEASVAVSQKATK